MSTSKPTGGPAFPIFNDNGYAHAAGLSIRDYIATSASASDLAGIRVKEDREALVGRDQPADYPNGIDSIKFALEVEAALRYMFADAMLEARAKA